MVLLQTILIILIVYYAIKILWKWLGPKILKYAVRKTEERFEQQFRGFQGNQQRRAAEGETVVIKKSPKHSKSTKKVGEYIDFEEID